MSEHPMKLHADDENEIHDVVNFEDPARNVVTPVLRLPPELSLPVVQAFAALVRSAHASDVATTPDEDGITRAQVTCTCWKSPSTGTSPAAT